MKLSGNLKIGANYRAQLVDSQGNVKGENDWGCNLILDSATNLMRDGYTMQPTPKLGSSILDTDPTQNGVQAHIPTMVLESHTPRWEGFMLDGTSISKKATWGTTFRFVNEGTSAASVSEIGYDNLNRMVFKDENGQVITWSVDPGDVLIIDENFAITFNAPSTATNVNIVDQANNVTGAVTAVLKVLDTVDSETTNWWHLLKKPTSAVYLINDPTWNGEASPSLGARIIPSAEPIYTYVDRSIAINVQHRGRTGGDQIHGAIVQFGTLSPVFAVVFDQPIDVGSGYLFEINLTANW